MDILHLAAPCRNVPVTYTLHLMERLRNSVPVLLAMLVVTLLHGWHASVLLLEDISTSAALSLVLRGIPATLLALSPAWLPALVPSSVPLLRKWVRLVCGAVAAAIALSFVVVFALDPEKFLLVVVSVYGVVGACHLAGTFNRRSSEVQA